MSIIFVRYNPFANIWETQADSVAPRNWQMIPLSDGRCSILEIRNRFKANCDVRYVSFYDSGLVLEPTEYKLTDKQYQLMTELFNELNDAFYSAPAEIQNAYFKRLYAK